MINRPYYWLAALICLTAPTPTQELHATTLDMGLIDFTGQVSQKCLKEQPLRFDRINYSHPCFGGRITGTCSDAELKLTASGPGGGTFWANQISSTVINNQEMSCFSDIVPRFGSEDCGHSFPFPPSFEFASVPVAAGTYTLTLQYVQRPGALSAPPINLGGIEVQIGSNGGCAGTRDFPNKPSFLNQGDIAIGQVVVPDLGQIPPKATLSVLAGNNQSAAITKSLSEALTVLVTENNQPKDGVPIAFEITQQPPGAQGASLSSNQSTTDQQGQASTHLTLGNKQGVYRVTATCNDCQDPKTITFALTAQTAQLSKITEEPIIATVNSNVSAAVKTTDPSPPSSPITNVEINWSAQGPSPAQPNPVQSFTDSGGLAQTSLTLGDMQGDYTIIAESPDTTPSSVQFKACGKLDVPYINQGVNPWDDKPYDSICRPFPGSTDVVRCSPSDPNQVTWKIGEKGCALTSAVMILNYYANLLNKPEIKTDPLALNQWLVDNNGYLNDPKKGKFGIVRWDRVTKFSGVLRYLDDKFSLHDSTAIAADLSNNQPVVLAQPGHFVVAVARCGDKTLINDPGFSNRTDLDSYNNTSTGLRRFFVDPSGDKSAIVVGGGSPIELLLLDPQGNKHGFDPTTQTTVGSGGYGRESLADDVTGAPGPEALI
ncbi:MAG: C39 family peptidase, partial [Elusimicrobia bacterium]|nr:C39 family peptidase [Elusimicrobiota bacterium]